MTQLHVTIETPDVKTAGELKDELLKHYKSSIFGIEAKECSVFINTVLSDENWADIAKSFSKNKSAILSMKASASFGDGFYKVYKSIFKDGKEFEDEPENHSIYDE